MESAKIAGGEHKPSGRTYPEATPLGGMKDL